MLQRMKSRVKDMAPRLFKRDIGRQQQAGTARETDLDWRLGASPFGPSGARESDCEGSQIDRVDSSKSSLRHTNALHVPSSNNRLHAATQASRRHQAKVAVAHHYWEKAIESVRLGSSHSLGSLHSDSGGDGGVLRASSGGACGGESQGWDDSRAHGDKRPDASDSAGEQTRGVGVPKGAAVGGEIKELEWGEEEAGSAEEDMQSKSKAEHHKQSGMKNRDGGAVSMDRSVPPNRPPPPRPVGPKQTVFTGTCAEAVTDAGAASTGDCVGPKHSLPSEMYAQSVAHAGAASGIEDDSAAGLDPTELGSADAKSRDSAIEVPSPSSLFASALVRALVCPENRTGEPGSGDAHFSGPSTGSYHTPVGPISQGSPLASEAIRGVAVCLSTSHAACLPACMPVLLWSRITQRSIGNHETRPGSDTRSRIACVHARARVCICVAFLP